MANSYFNQFFMAKDKGLVGIQGTLSLAAPVLAAVTAQGLTYTAKAFGTLGDGISITLVDGGTAGAETVAVNGKEIVVTMEDGVSTQGDIKAAIDNDAAASALVSVAAASSGTAVDEAAAVVTSGGVDLAKGNILGVASVAQTGTGQITLTLQETYNAFLAGQLTLGAAAAVDLVPQFGAIDVTSQKTIVIRLNAGATPTNPAAAAQLYVSLLLRNSSVAV